MEEKKVPGSAVVIAIVLLAIGLGIGVPALFLSGKPERPKDAPPLSGAELYKLYNCVFCHGEDGAGPRADIRPLAKKGDAARIAATIRDPRSMKPDAQMPNLQLAEPEIAALASYVIELGRH